MPLTAGVKKSTHLVPRTSTRPIQLWEYMQKQARSRVVDDDRLRQEWKDWYDARRGRIVEE